MDGELKRLLLESVAAGKLVTLVGAGLSMAPPTRAPSAKDVADNCRANYLKDVGEPLPLPDDAGIDIIAEWFLTNAHFAEFIEKMLPWPEFRGLTRKFNAGHMAIADLLACHALEVCVTTNYDLFVEMAAGELGEPDFQANREPEDLPRHLDHSPYLKVHGCCYGGRDRLRTIWCKGQLANPNLAERTGRFRVWLEAHLQDRDLLIVGFWSDWAYLTDILADSLTATTPRNVILVDPSHQDDLAEKAPSLWRWVHRDDITFSHVQESGASFLREFEICFGRVFIAKLVRDASATHARLFGKPPASGPESYGEEETLYGLRRILTGTLMHEPVRFREPDCARQQLVAIHARIIDQGAVFTGTHYEFKGEHIRIVNGSGEVLSAAKKRYSMEPASPVNWDRTVCVGASED